VHRNPQLGDHLAKQGAAGLVDLLGHQSWHHLNDVRAQSELAQRVGGLKTQQTAADDNTGVGVAVVQRALGVGADGVEVVERAVDVAGRQVVAGYRWNERVGPGCQHQCLVSMPLPVGGEHRFGWAVDLGDPAAQQQPDPLVTGIVVAWQGQ
jgi:hypothetical protein